MYIAMGLRTLLGLKNKLPYLNESYAQEGEDNILYRLFEDKANGFFIAIGAHHPTKNSNTYKFYKMGWRGINIDAMPGSMRSFNQTRSGDINLEVPVSDKEESLPFFIFNEPALNTFSRELANSRDNERQYRIKDVVTVQTQTLAKILDQHLLPGQTISFLSVDAEGYDQKILLSNNWTKYRPEVILLESGFTYQDFMSSDINKLLVNKGYEFFAKTANTYFLRDKISGKLPTS